jgi:hypothetical protein
VYPDPAHLRKPSSNSSAGSRSVPSSSNVLDNAESLRSKLAREDNEALAGDPDAVMNELINLRKKYDAVVDYSAHLTAERDSIVAQFEDLQREYAREIGQKKAEGKAGKVERLVERKPVQQVSEHGSVRGLYALLSVLPGILAGSDGDSRVCKHFSWSLF